MVKTDWHSPAEKKPKNLQKITFLAENNLTLFHGLYIESEDMFFVGFDEVSKDFYYSQQVVSWTGFVSTEKSILATDWLEKQLRRKYIFFTNVIITFEKSKEMERQKMIDFLKWMNKVSENNPMAFETDNDDIVNMFIQDYYK